jgi:hypothetical protein
MDSDLGPAMVCCSLTKDPRAAAVVGGDVAVVVRGAETVAAVDDAAAAEESCGDATSSQLPSA